MARGDQSLQQRTAGYLASKYAHDQACSLAHDIDCDIRTAKNLLKGHWPAARHFQKIVQHFGRDFYECVFAPDVEATTARLAAEVRDLEQQLEEKRALARQAQGVLPRLAGIHPQNEDGSAEVTAGSRRNG